MAITPVRDYLFVTMKENNRTDAGVLLPESARKVELVIAKCGPDAPYKKGQKVFLGSDMNLSKINYDGKEYFLIRASDIVAID